MIICPVCGVEVTVPATAKSGDILVCPVCYARLRLLSTAGGWGCEVA